MPLTGIKAAVAAVTQVFWRQSSDILHVLVEAQAKTLTVAEQLPWVIVIGPGNKTPSHGPAVQRSFGSQPIITLRN